LFPPEGGLPPVTLNSPPTGAEKARRSLQAPTKERVGKSPQIAVEKAVNPGRTAVMAEVREGLRTALPKE